MRFTTLICIFILAMSIASCKDDTKPAPAEQLFFSLTLSVRDTAGQPVPNLLVVGGSLTSLYNLQGQGLQAWAAGVYRARYVATDTGSGAVLFRDSILMVFGEVDESNPTSFLGTTSARGELALSDARHFAGIYSLPPMPETYNDPTPLGHFSILDTAIFIFKDTLTHRRQVERRVIRAGENSVSVVWSPATAQAAYGTGRTQEATGRHAPEAPAGDRRRSPLAGRYIPGSALGVSVIEFQVARTAHVKISTARIGGPDTYTLIDDTVDDGVQTVEWSVTPSGQPAVFKAGGPMRPLTPAVEWKLYQNYPNPFN